MRWKLLLVPIAMIFAIFFLLGPRLNTWYLYDRLEIPRNGHILKISLLGDGIAKNRYLYSTYVAKNPYWLSVRVWFPGETGKIV